MKCISINHKKLNVDLREMFALNESERKRFFEIIKSDKKVKECVLLMTCNRCEIYFSDFRAETEKKNEDHGNEDQQESELKSIQAERKSAEQGDEEPKDKELENIQHKINDNLKRNNLPACEFEYVEDLLGEVKAIDLEYIKDNAMRYEGMRSIEHLFKVVCGLDSAVLGEVEIIRQVKQAYEEAGKNDMVSGEFNIIFQGALCMAKEVADKSLMTKLPVSVGTLTTFAVKEFCKDMDSINVLVVGASGEVGSIVIKDLMDEGSNINVVGTSRKHGTELFKGIKREGLSWIHYDERYNYLEWADVIISATNSPHYTFLASTIKKYVKNVKNDVKNVKYIKDGEANKLKLFLDLSVPRDIDSMVGEIPNCVLKNIDYIKMLAKDNNEKKLKEAKRIEGAIKIRCDQIKKELIFRSFIMNNNEMVENFKNKDSMWLLYKLKEKLDGEMFQSVLESLDVSD